MRSSVTARALRWAGWSIYTLCAVEILVRLCLLYGPVHLPAWGDAASPAPAWCSQLGPHDHGAFRDQRWSATRGWTNLPRDSVAEARTVNALGIRGRSDPVGPPIPSVHRMVALGDSFLFALSVRDEDVSVAIADHALEDLEILNLGVPGYGQDQMLLTLQEALPAFRPDLVMVTWFEDDVQRNLYDFTTARKPRFVLDGGALVLESSPVPDPERMQALTRWRCATCDVWHTLTGHGGMDAAAEDDQAWDLSAALLREMVLSTRRSGAEPVLVYMPVPWLGAQGAGQVHRREPMLEVCASEHVECLDLRPAFVAALGTGQVLVEETRHWNAAGNRVAGEAMIPFLRGVIDR